MKNADQPIGEWRAINGYVGIYEVSSHGRIKALPRNIHYCTGKTVFKKEQILNPVLNKHNGYYYIGLSLNKIRKTYRLHRIVSQAFIDNPLNLPEVNHKDYDKSNNRTENLEWADRYYQNQHSAKKPNRKWQNHRLGMIGSLNPKSIPVVVYDLQGNFIAKYESGCIAAKATNSNQSSISKCCKGQRKSHNNLKFQYEITTGL